MVGSINRFSRFQVLALVLALIKYSQFLLIGLYEHSNKFFDIINCLTQFLEQFDTTKYMTALTYDKDNRITALNYND